MPEYLERNELEALLAWPTPAISMVEDWERRIINFCKSDEFSLDGLKERYLAPKPAWPRGKIQLGAEVLGAAPYALRYFFLRRGL